MINLIRKALEKNDVLYGLAASIYHQSKNFGMMIYCRINGIKYFSPNKRYSDKYKAQYGQDYVLERLGLIRSNGFFVEIGSNDPIFNSNSYYLEHEYNYRGISVDPINYGDRFKRERPQTEFVNCLIDNEKSEIEFFEVENKEGWQNQMSSLYKETLQQGREFIYKSRIVPARRLSDICKNVKEIDILLLDVEGHEIKVLESYDWSHSVIPKVIISENCGSFYPRAVLINYLRDRGYKLIARIGTSDDIFKYSGI